MKAVLSFTADPLYSFFVPIVVKTWNMLGVNCMIFYPRSMYKDKRLEVIKQYSSSVWRNFFFPFDCEPKREPTYSQVSRLFGAAEVHMDLNERLITTDADMAVFSNIFLQDPMEILVIGGDLVDGYQLPMCYVSMPVWKWRTVMKIEAPLNGQIKSYQKYLEEIIDKIEGQNVRGEQWCLDQFLVTRAIRDSGLKFKIVERAKSLQQRVATNRADRDYWYNIDYENLIDAHLPRPGYEISNWNKICDLFFQMQLKKGVDFNISWMNEYRNEFLKTL